VTMAYTGMVTEMETYGGHNGDQLETYFAQPAGDGPFPGVVVIHHGILGIVNPERVFELPDAPVLVHRVFEEA